MARMSRLLIALTWALSLSSAVHGSITTDIMKGLDQAVDCNSCLALLIILDLLARLGDSAFIKTLITICKNLEVRGFAILPVGLDDARRLGGRPRRL